MMNKKKIILSVLILVSLVLSYFWNKTRDTQLHDKNTINTVTLVDDRSNNEQQEHVIKKHLEDNEITQLDIDPAILKEQIDANLAKSSYMQIFDDYLLAKTCEKITDTYGYHFYDKKEVDFDFYSVIGQEVDPRDVLVDKWGIENTTPTQIKSWEILIADCEALYSHYLLLVNKINREYSLDYSDIWDEKRQLHDVLYDALLKKEAKSEQAKSLKKVLTLKTQYKELRSVSLINELTKYSISDTEVKQIKQDILSLNRQYESLDQNDEAQLMNIEDEIGNKLEYLESKEVKDVETFEQYRKQFIALHYQLMAMLSESSVDEFKLIFDTLTTGLLVFDENGNDALYHELKLTVINREIYQNNDIKDPEYYNILIKPAMNLFYCYKGMDCSVDSLVVADYCFGLSDYLSADHKACESDLQTYYFNQYFSTNQTVDVNILFDYLVSYYDQ